MPSAMEHLAEYFKVFSEPNRLAVLEALRDGALNVTAVVERTRESLDKWGLSGRSEQERVPWL